MLGPEVVVGVAGLMPGVDVAVGGEFAGATLLPEPLPDSFEQPARAIAATIAKGTANRIFIWLLLKTRCTEVYWCAECVWVKLYKG